MSREMKRAGDGARNPGWFAPDMRGKTDIPTSSSVPHIQAPSEDAVSVNPMSKYHDITRVYSTILPRAFAGSPPPPDSPNDDKYRNDPSVWGEVIVRKQTNNIVGFDSFSGDSKK